MGIGQGTDRDHLDIHRDSGFGGFSVGVGFDEGVVEKRVWLGDFVEQLVGVVEE